jgi:hypothetical protein
MVYAASDGCRLEIFGNPSLSLSPKGEGCNEFPSSFQKKDWGMKPGIRAAWELYFAFPWPATAFIAASIAAGSPR